ncbi:MAG TPA: TolC family protein [Terriglobales bacterium]|jgi:outer membrane protein|nr:TolC family protein [Terriglobales bacterium]
MKAVASFLLLSLLAASAAAQANQPLTLADCYRIAEQNHPDLATAQDLVQASQARLRQRHSAYLPRLDFGISHNQTTYNYAPQPGTSPRQFAQFYQGESATTSPYYYAGLNFSQTIYDFGRTRGSVQRGQAELAASEQNRERTRQQVLLNVRTSYFGVLAAQELVTVRQNAVQDQTRHLEQIQAFFQVGRSPKIDLTRQEVQLANSQLDLTQAQSDLQVARAALAVSMGLPVQGAPAIVNALGEEAALGPLPGLLSQAEKSRPDVRSVQQQVSAAQADVLAARANTRPNIAFSSFYDYRNLRFPLIYNFGIGETLLQNLFSGGLYHSILEEAQFRLAASQSSLRSYLQQVDQEVYTDYQDASVAQDKIALAEKAADEAQQNLAFAEGRYAAGVGNIIELTDAELLATTTQSQLVEARYAYQVAVGRLQVATGQDPQH